MIVNVKDKFGEIIETHDSAHSTVKSWLSESIPDFDSRVHHPISVFINGSYASFDAIDARRTGPDDVVDVVIEPQAAMPWYYWVYTALAAAYTYYTVSNLDLPTFQKTTGEGNSIYSGSRGSANVASPNGLIREVSGSPTIYPDLIQRGPIKRYSGFYERTYMLLSVGVGWYDITADNIYIGDTKASDLAGSVTVEVHNPGHVFAGNPEPAPLSSNSITITYTGAQSFSQINIKYGSNPFDPTQTREILLNDYVAAEEVISLDTYDTISDLATYINGLTDYTCTYSGTGSTDSMMLIATVGYVLTNVATTFNCGDNFFAIKHVGAAPTCDISVFEGQLITSQGLNISLASYDTLGDLATYIDGLADYECSIIGDDTLTALTIEEFFLPISIKNITYLLSDPSRELLTLPTAAHQNWYESPDIKDIDLYGTKSVNLDGGLYAYYIENDSGTYRLRVKKDGVAFTDFENSNGIVLRLNSKIYWKMTSGDGTAGKRVEERFDSVTGIRTWDNLADSTEAETTLNSMTIENSQQELGPWYICPEGETTQAIEVDIVYPNGGFVMDGDNKRSIPDSLTIYVGSDENEAFEPVLLYPDQGSFFGSVKPTGGGATYRYVTKSKIRPRIKLYPDSDNQDGGQIMASKKIIKRVKCLLDTQTTYPDVTTISFSTVAGNEISRSAEDKINIRGAKRRLPTLAEIQAESWDLSSGGGTRSIARFVAWMIYDSLGSAALAKVNWTALEALEELWEEREDFLDAEFIDETTLWEALKVALVPGYSEPTIKDGKLLPVRSSTGSDFTQFYNPDVMTGDGLQIDYEFKAGIEPDGVEVEFFNAATNGMDVVQCLLDGDAGLRPKRINAIGITSKQKAWRLGMRERRRLAYRPAKISFSTELDALNSEYGEPIMLASDLFPQYGASPVNYGVVKNVTVDGGTTTIRADFEHDWTAGDNYAIFRTREGGVSGPYSVSQTSGKEFILVTPDALDFTYVAEGGAMDQTLVTIGHETDFYKRAIVKNITVEGEDSVSVVAEEYVAEIFADDDGSPP
jgi:hypothetical protein